MSRGPHWSTGTITVRVPATSANLGPGFDSFGLALAMYDEVAVRLTDPSPAGEAGGLVLGVVGEGAETVPKDASHLVVRSLLTCLQRMDVEVPRGLEVACRNRIPHGRGLGSSSAAIVAGVTAARALLEDGADRLDDAGLLGLACEIEGHPDNVAACLCGGFTIAWTEPTGPRVAVLAPALGIDPVVFIPASELETKQARGLLPAAVPHADAAANSARAALLVHAVTVAPELLLSATEDRLHQDYRRSAMPASLELVDRLRADGIPTVVSGAGPTVLALAGPTTADQVAAAAPLGWRVERLAVDHSGAAVSVRPSVAERA